MRESRARGEQRKRETPLAEQALSAAIALMVALLPVAFGAVHVWAYSLMALTSMALLTAFCLRMALTGEGMPSLQTLGLMGAALLFFLAAALQMVPLPEGLSTALSPRGAEVYARATSGLVEQNLRHPLSLDIHSTKVALIKYASYASVFFLLAHLAQRRRNRDLVLSALVLSGALLALYGLYGYFSRSTSILGYGRLPLMDSATGTFVNRNHFAGYLGLTFFCGLGYLSYRARATSALGLRENALDLLRDSRGPVLGGLGVALLAMVLGILFSLSRMGVLSFVLTGLLLAAVAFTWRRRGLFLLISLALALSLGAGLYYGLGPLQKRFSESPEALETTRLPLWKAAAAMVRDYPLTGTGLGSFESAAQGYKQFGEFTATTMNHAHNDYLELFSDMGFPVGVLVLAALGYIVLQILRGAYRASLEDNRLLGLGVGLSGAALYMALHSFADFNLHIPSNAMAFFAVLGVGYGALVPKSGPLSPTGRTGLSLRLAAALMVVPAALLMAYLTVRHWRAEALWPAQKSFILERAAFPSLKDREQIALLTEALESEPDNYLYHAVLGQQLSAEAAGSRGLGRTQLLKDSIGAFGAALYLNPANTSLLVSLGWAELSDGDYETGLMHMRTAVEAAPGDYYVHAMYGTALMNFLDRLPGQKQELLEAAQRELNTGLRLYPHMLMDPLILKALVYANLGLGQTETALKFLEGLYVINEETLPLHLKAAELYYDTERPREGHFKYYRIAPKLSGAMLGKYLDHMAGVLKRHPTDDKLRVLFVRQALRGQRAELALEALGQARDNASELLRSEALVALGRHEEALDIYLGLLKRYPNNQAISEKARELLLRKGK